MLCWPLLLSFETRGEFKNGEVSETLASGEIAAYSFFFSWHRSISTMMLVNRPIPTSAEPKINRPRPL